MIMIDGFDEDISPPGSVHTLRTVGSSHAVRDVLVSFPVKETVAKENFRRVTLVP